MGKFFSILNGTSFEQVLEQRPPEAPSSSTALGLSSLPSFSLWLPSHQPQFDPAHRAPAHGGPYSSPS